MHLRWLTPPRSYRTTTCRERELTLEVHYGSYIRPSVIPIMSKIRPLPNVTYILFWPHKDMEGLPEWGISSMRGPPPRLHVHERRYASFTHPFILTRWIWKGDYDGQMIFRDLCEPKASWHLSYRWGKNPENLTQVTCLDRGSNPCPLPDRRACYRLIHSGELILLSHSKKVF